MSAFTDALVDRLAAVAETAGGDPVVELAVGRRPAVAVALARRGFAVLATDLHHRDLPESVPFVRDDLTDPDVSRYERAAVFYARNLPAELQRPARDLAAAVGAPLYFTTLGAEEPVIPVDRETLATETLYRATEGPDPTAASR